MKTKLFKTLLVSLVISLSSPVLAQDSIKQDTVRKRPRIALALGGGGARGAAHIGVLKVLEKNNLKPDLIVGNSMGAIIGSLYCAGIPPEKIEAMVHDGRVKKAFKPVPIPVQMFKKLGRALIFWKKTYPGFYSGKSLAKFINEHIGEDHRFEDLKLPFAAVVVDFKDGKAYRIEEGDVGEAVRASSSFPPVFKPVEIEDHVYADGGIRANLPTVPARNMGADIVIAVNVNEKLHMMSKDELKSYGSMINRMTSIIIAVRDEEHKDEADLIIHPDVSGISLLSIADKSYLKAIKSGEEATLKSLPEIKKLFNRARLSSRPDKLH